MGEYLTAHPVLPDREAERLDAEAAAVRVTAGQRRAALAVLDDRAAYATLDDLAAALALAVITAEDDKTRSVVCVQNPGGGGFWVYGPYATFGAAEKAMASGLALCEGARGGVFPLIPVPKAAKKAAPKRSTRPARPAA